MKFLLVNGSLEHLFSGRVQRLSNPAMLTKVRREYAIAMIWNGV